MCGVSGVIHKTDRQDDSAWSLQKSAKKLARLAGRRGQDALGLATISPSEVKLCKLFHGNLDAFVRSRPFHDQLDIWSTLTSQKALFLFNRLQIVGDKAETENNGPLVVDGLIGMHNGIVCNPDELWDLMPDSTAEFDVDSEALFKLLAKHWSAKGFAEYLDLLKQKLKGSFTIAAYNQSGHEFLFATNTGSFHFAECDKFFAFSSERSFLYDSGLLKSYPHLKVKRLEPWSFKHLSFE